MPTINWKAAVIASLLAGLAFLILDLALVATVGGQSLWGPPRMIGAILLGEGVLTPLDTFNAESFLAAVVVHAALSLIYGSIFAWFANQAGWSLSASALIGVLFGLAIYAVNFYGMTALFPWFETARNGISIFAHAVFGLVLGYTYRKLAPYVVIADFEPET